MNSYTMPIEATMKVIGGKWKVVILCHLILGKRRTSELRLLMPISQKMLTQQLRELEKDGLVKRTVFHTVPLKVEYSLTDYGWTLRPALDLMCAWGEQHILKHYDNKYDVLEESILNQ